MKILIAGAAGFLGSHIANHLVKTYPAYQVVGLDNLSTGSLDNLSQLQDKENFAFIRGDVASPAETAAIFSRQQPQAVINAVFDKSEQSLIKTMVYGNYLLLKQAVVAGVKRFIYLSSDDVYGESRSALAGGLRPSRETDPLQPQTPLAAAQAGADLMTLSFFRSKLLPSVVLRVGNVVGPGEHADRLLPLLITQAIKNKPLPIYGDGKHTRCFLALADFIAAVDLVLHNKKAVGEAFNVSSGKEYQILQAVELILSILGRPKDLISFVDDQKPHTLSRSLEVQKIKDELGWQAKTDFNQALKETLRWYQKHLIA